MVEAGEREVRKALRTYTTKMRWQIRDGDRVLAIGRDREALEELHAALEVGELCSYP